MRRTADAPPRRRQPHWLARSCALAGSVIVVGAAAALLALAASGVFDRRPGAWTLPVRPLPGAHLHLNASGLLRLATSPLGVRLLDGFARDTAAGTLGFAREGEALRVRCAPCQIRDDRLAAQPVALPTIEIRLVRRAGVENNNVLDVQLTSGSLHATAVAVLASDGVQVEWQLPATPIVALAQTLGAAVPEAHLAQIEGTVHGRGRLALPSGSARVTLQFERLEVAGLGTERFRHGPFSFGCARGDGTLREVVSGDGASTWASLDALGPLLARAVLAAEDPRFEEHAGYETAARSGTSAGAELPEANTLNQALARTLFIGDDRSLAGRLRALLYAVEMERTLGKPRILELHLNTVAWGAGVCGARAASRHYFGRRVPQLTPLQVAWLAGILRAPQAAAEQTYVVGGPQYQRTRAVLMQLHDLPLAERERWARAPLARVAPRAERGHQRSRVDASAGLQCHAGTHPDPPGRDDARSHAAVTTHRRHAARTDRLLHARAWRAGTDDLEQRIADADAGASERQQIDARDDDVPPQGHRIDERHARQRGDDRQVLGLDQGHLPRRQLGLPAASQSIVGQTDAGKCLGGVDRTGRLARITAHDQLRHLPKHRSGRPRQVENRHRCPARALRATRR